MTTTVTATEELKIRLLSEKAWSKHRVNQLGLTPKQAFIEGHFMAFSMGLLACLQIQKDADQRIRLLEVWLGVTQVALLGILIFELMS